VTGDSVRKKRVEGVINTYWSLVHFEVKPGHKELGDGEKVEANPDVLDSFLERLSVIIESGKYGKK